MLCAIAELNQRPAVDDSTVVALRKQLEKETALKKSVCHVYLYMLLLQYKIRLANMYYMQLLCIIYLVCNISNVI